ncbi:MFS general substrate transporter [Crucibulum laeve]|uniref:MFS general substrate transporter n=1 Tax=Crucibulum laeve TaxID=68775 RepID=A0A5C3LVW5_9AGAR|nr:MFS general substrate transporter [Crucibulum laeve]
MSPSPSTSSTNPSIGPLSPHDAVKTMFTKTEKWFIVLLIAFAGLFSPLTANIYFPAIPTLSRAFNKSTELINLTVTMYMILQGIAPMFWGPVSDHWGRRPAGAVCLMILSISCVGLALVPTSDYWLLMVLRCVQAAGSASTIAIGAGVIGDISTREERGGFFGVFTLGPMIGPAIGPVIGGVLADRLGWRSIFWFMCIASSVCLVVMILLMPETLRSRVLSGKCLPFVHRPLIPVIGKRVNSGLQASNPPSGQDRPKNPLRLFTFPDILILLAITALICAVFYGVLASISTLFETAYPFLNETTIGLCFMAMGGGMAVGSSINGRVLDFEYQLIKKQQMRRSHDAQEDDFPIEKARLRLLPMLVLLMSACCAGYGWCLQKKVNIAVPLILNVAMGYVSIAVMNSASTLMIDLVPNQGSSVTGCNNLVRCLLSAAVVSVIDLIINGIGVGWTYVLLSGLSLLSIPLIYIAIRLGPSIRTKRRERLRQVDQSAEKDASQA